MNVLFYQSGVYKENYTPDQFTEEIWGAYLAVDSLFKCIVDFEYPQKMSIRIDDPQGVPYCTMHINHEEYQMVKHLCKDRIIFEKEELLLEEE
jgi:hypothetical protein